MASPTNKAKEASAVYSYGMCGNLQKRQRGRSWLRNEKDRRALVFQERFCMLKKHYFTYTINEEVSYWYSANK